MTMSAQAPATAIAKAARRLQQEAEGHSQLARQHRKRALTLYRELDELVARCAECGIEVELHPVEMTANAQGGNGGNHRGKAG